jgi:hypothetical protein
MATWIIIWIVFWFSVMGLPNYLFKKYKITYYENPWKHTLFFFFSIVMLFAVYQNVYAVYFNTFSSYHLLVVCCLFLVYLFVPVACHNEYYTKKELLGYQLPKFFEILFQQFCFLGGLLTFGVSPIMFGILFFVVHVPAIFLLPKKFALFPIIASLAGGLVFAYLQSYGISGFLIALSIHLLFWASFHHALTKNLLGIIPIKR